MVFMNRNKQEGYMKIRYPILLIAWLLPFGAARAQTLLDKLKSALSDYCVPRDEETCANQEAMATYDTAKKKCRCPCEDQAYDTTLRKCVDCEDGSGSQYSTACNVVACAEGYMAAEISSGCPEGHMVFEESGGCPEGHLVFNIPRICDFGLIDDDGKAADGCPAGYSFTNI
jgi:hypothetical protein